MNLDEEIRSIAAHIAGMQKILESLEERLDRAKGAWPSHQIIPAKWNDRSVPPPAGEIWASDGINVWLIRTDGGPIDAGATAVRFWTTAYIPAPPNGRA